MTAKNHGKLKEKVDEQHSQNEAIYDKFGGEKKCRDLVEKIHENLSENPIMCQYFRK